MSDFLKWFLNLLNKEPSISISVSLGSGYSTDKLMKRDKDINLSDHFTLFEMTATSNASLQEKNRDLSDAQVEKLEKLARLAETIRTLCGAPIHIHSGYRCPGLNGATVGSSSTSQHPLCEAIDFDVKDQTVEDSFKTLVESARQGKIRFGQLILERAERSYGSVQWIHCSLIGSLPLEKVGQIMKMSAGKDGKSIYTLVERIKQC